jgi:hypothetical protein
MHQWLLVQFLVLLMMDAESVRNKDLAVDGCVGPSNTTELSRVFYWFCDDMFRPWMAIFRSIAIYRKEWANVDMCYMRNKHVKEIVTITGSSLSYWETHVRHNKPVNTVVIERHCCNGKHIYVMVTLMSLLRWQAWVFMLCVLWQGGVRCLQLWWCEYGETRVRYIGVNTYCCCN